MHINDLNIVPTWRFEDIDGNTLHLSLLPLLDAINRTQKLTKAAKECRVSYRHAWNILQEAEEFFGGSVTIMERGRGASLTPLGEVLLQANQRIDARLHTQLESLSMELNSHIHKVLSDQVRVMTIYASHGYGVALVPKHIKGYQAEMHYHSPEDALLALHAGSCKLAGFNLPLHQQIGEQQNRYRALLSEDKVKIIRFIKRQQGLMVKSNNSHKITSLKDLADADIRFINRQPHSGTRELFDQLLLESNILGNSIKGYDQYEYTHTAVAAQVATGMADVGFGVHAAAAKFDLEFIPITEDTYLWAYQLGDENDPEIIAFIEMLKSKKFQDEVNKLAGYACDNSGALAELNDFISFS